jgi:hypothetical protein
MRLLCSQNPILQALSLKEDNQQQSTLPCGIGGFYLYTSMIVMTTDENMSDRWLLTRRSQ